MWFNKSEFQSKAKQISGRNTQLALKLKKFRRTFVSTVNEVH